MEKKNRELRIMIDGYKAQRETNANPLTMALKGTVDAVVMVCRLGGARLNIRYGHFFHVCRLAAMPLKRQKQWLAMETKSTCILRSGKGGTKRHAFSDRTFDRKIFQQKDL